MSRTLTAAALAVALLGCNDAPTPQAKDKSESSATTAEAKKSGHDHGHWWCKPHGIPEDECLTCKYEGREAELKKKGDWGEKHEVAKSQCFACNPGLKERYAAQYKAKYGKESPEPTENPAKD